MTIVQDMDAARLRYVQSMIPVGPNNPQVSTITMGGKTYAVSAAQYAKDAGISVEAVMAARAPAVSTSSATPSPVAKRWYIEKTMADVREAPAGDIDFTWSNAKDAASLNYAAASRRTGGMNTLKQRQLYATKAGLKVTHPDAVLVVAPAPAQVAQVAVEKMWHISADPLGPRETTNLDYDVMWRSQKDAAALNYTVAVRKSGGKSTEASRTKYAPLKGVAQTGNTAVSVPSVSAPSVVQPTVSMPKEDPRTQRVGPEPRVSEALQEAILEASLSADSLEQDAKRVAVQPSAPANDRSLLYVIGGFTISSIILVYALTRMRKEDTNSQRKE